VERCCDRAQLFHELQTLGVLREESKQLVKAVVDATIRFLAKRWKCFRISAEPEGMRQSNALRESTTCLETSRSLEALRLGILSFLADMADLYTAATVLAVFFTFAAVLQSPKFYR